MKSRMRFFRSIFALVSAAAVMVGCSGTVDDSSLPVLAVSDEEIDLATETEAEFTVTYNGQDVTAESEFFLNGSTAPYKGNVFTPEEEGSYSFHAEYDGKISNVVTVNVVDSNPKVESKYERHVLLAEFTGAWCVNCPKGYTEMMGKLELPSMKKYRDFIHLCAFHSDVEGKDGLAIPATQDVFGLFKGLAYPSFVTDLRNVDGHFGNLTEDGISNVQPSLIASFEDYPAHCGVAVSSDVNEGKAKVNVKVASELTSVYRVVVLVVENGIVYPQKSPMYPDGQEDYIHNHVVRRIVTKYVNTFTGEKITDDGRITAGEEASGVWEFDVDGEWNLGNTEIYALVLDSRGYVNNMNHCPVDNGESGYKMKKQ